jgi:hypothetical protein
MKNIVFILFCSIAFFSCRKEEKKHKVIYKVAVISGHPTFTVQYSAENNTTKTAGPLTSSSWLSPKVEDRETGNVVSLTLESKGGASYNMYIYVDGYLEQEGRMDDPYGPKTISVEIPD